MSKSRLPRSVHEQWSGGFILEPPRLVQSISARGGLVIAGGPDLYLLAPRAPGMMSRPSPLDIGTINVVAVEPREPHRYAVASDTMLAIFFRSGGEDQIVRIRPDPPDLVATHLAWGGSKGPCSLYVRWSDGSIGRMKPDLSDLETLEVPPVMAVASDEAGVVAMVTLDPESLVFVAKADDEMDVRDIVFLIEDPLHVYVAVAGTSVAVSFDDGFTVLSRDPEEPLDLCEALMGTGPIEFQGASPDAALFGAIQEGTVAAIVRVDKEGAAMRIAELETEGSSPPRLLALSWDKTRHKLWGAASEAGIVNSDAPKPKRGTKTPSS